MNAWSHAVLTPTSLLLRAAAAHGDRTAIVDDDRTWSYTRLLDEALRMARTLSRISAGRPVAVLSPNTPGMLLAHFAIPWSGAPMVPLNTRLSATEIAALLDHSEAGILLYDPALTSLVTQACAQLHKPPRCISLVGAESRINPELLDAPAEYVAVADELQLLSINYTSGTTGRPKGVMYSHRGAYLQALAMMAHTQLDTSSTYLWTLPMFHCHGWCFPWAVAAAGGTNVCLPKVDPNRIWHNIDVNHITHLNGAPTVLTMIADAPEAHALGRSIRVATGGAPPSPAILRRMAALGFELTHLYGLTETYGPAVICDWRPEWDTKTATDKARLHARQGVGNIVSTPPRVIGPDGTDVAPDGATIGEIVLQGNNVMLGYYKDPEATRQAVRDDWFHTGDLGVRHPDGYIELRDRSKDIIISGGENIASVEVENAIAEHPGIAEVAVIGKPEERWGEIPIAYATLRDGHTVTEGEIIDLVRRHLAGYKAPKRVIFVDELPKTSTGKIKKHVLRTYDVAGSAD